LTSTGKELWQCIATMDTLVIQCQLS